MIPTIMYRDARHAPWKKSAMAWTDAELDFLNKTVGYEKYRVVRTSA